MMVCRFSIPFKLTNLGFRLSVGLGGRELEGGYSGGHLLTELLELQDCRCLL